MTFGLVKHNNNSISAVTSVGLTQGKMTLIKEQTASSSSSISFVNGSSSVVLDSTYPIYVFKYFDIHPATDNVKFNVNFRDGGSSYDATKTTTNFHGYHGEGAGDSSFGYSTGQDLAQSTSNLRISGNIGNENDESSSGELFLFNPSSTTFVKHFIITTNTYLQDNYSSPYYVAGYCNVTAAIDAVQFTVSSGNIDTGTIKLYGLKDS